LGWAEVYREVLFTETRKSLPLVRGSSLQDS